MLVTVSAPNEIARDLPSGAQRILRLASHIRSGTLVVCTPDGRRLRFVGREPGVDATIVVNDWAFTKRLASSGDLGFAEGYLHGEWDTPNLPALLTLLATNRDLVAALLPNRSALRIWQVLRHRLNRNTRAGAKRNIHAHYELGNRFYKAWLDPTMTYSSALFGQGDDDLASAQIRKYRALADALDLKPTHHVLEIGCGWGGFAAFAAEAIGCRVTALTISPAQATYARERIAQAGLADRVEIKLQDYRDERGFYDRVVAIEMFEAVGEAYWPVFFRTMAARLRAGGRAGLQVITIRNDRYAGYRRDIDFIRRFVFPGGALPPADALRSLGARSGLALEAERAFGRDYARTLVHWRERFRAAWPSIAPLGFDERFRRLWEYYFAYCEAGFRTGTIDVRQMVFAKP
ncbi:MAG TPA: cyclopropane-fatty-acyl-phospholipid synthase family protein [Microvirga sp.]|jgi:cyclopropane-fatty-acyl-phospholipid synthase|nr:cyclopropane-fatty-acyl-phospholipid synthase family protein [Microvirga sp.]